MSRYISNEKSTNSTLIYTVYMTTGQICSAYSTCTQSIDKVRVHVGRFTHYIFQQEDDVA